VLPSRALLLPPSGALALAACLAALAALAPAPAQATTFLETSVEELARGSEVVVRGRVLGRTSRWHGGRIVTSVRVAVASAWKGAPGAELEVVVPGGRVGDLAQHVAGSPTFRADEEVVVFAARSAPDTLEVTGLALGKFRVEGGVARPQLEGARVELRPLAAGERASGAMPVEELEARVRATR
jgi:hypothetical protein